jgi:hypothetical protein
MARMIRTHPSQMTASAAGTDSTLRTGALLPLFGAGLYETQNTPKINPGPFAALTDVTVTANAGATTLQLASAAGVSTANINAGAQMTIAGKSYTVVKGDTAIAGKVTVEVGQALEFDAVGTAVSFVTSTEHTANTILFKNSMIVVSRPLIAPMGLASECCYAVWSDELQMGLRITKGYDMKTKKDTMSVDGLWGSKVLVPRGICRIMG